MFYMYDKQEMNYKKKNGILFLYSFFSCLITAIFCISFFYVIEKNNKKTLTEEERVLILKEFQNNFSQEEFMRELIRLNIKYPHIVMAQAIQESSFKSPIFKHNHNMLGMKPASKRPTTNIGEQFKHANYDNWKDAVVDYALWQSTFIMKVKNENEYYDILDRIYSESEDYVSVIKPNAEKFKIIFKELREKIKDE